MSGRLEHDDDFEQDIFNRIDCQNILSAAYRLQTATQLQHATLSPLSLRRLKESSRIISEILEKEKSV
jgi:hypothetical protein